MTPTDLFQIRDRLHFPEWLTEHGLVGRGVEVGVLFGEYSKHLLTYWPGHLTLVDPWLNQNPSEYLDGCNACDMNAAYQKTLDAVAAFGSRSTILRSFSEFAAAAVTDASLDFVYIDANHKEPAVTQDMRLWWEKIRSSGILAGHDFYERHDAYQDCGVKTAVQNFARVNDLLVHLTSCTSWFILKP